MPDTSSFKDLQKIQKRKVQVQFWYNFYNSYHYCSAIRRLIPEDIKRSKMQCRNTILKKVKNYIGNVLNPSKKNFLNKTKDDYVELKSTEEILSLFEISSKDYEEALSISDDSDSQIHYKRAPNSCFVNNYFCDGLMTGEANMDIQPVFNHYKAVAYMCAYLSKSEIECSVLMKQAAQDAFEKELDNYEQMKSVANSYVLEKRFRVCLNEDKIFELPEDSNKILKRNVVDWYKDHPNTTSSGGKFAVLDTLSVFKTLLFTPSIPKYKENDFQPEELDDESM